MRILKLTIILATILSLGACREDQVVILSEKVPVAPPEIQGGLVGFYLLNEGNMGSNKCTLDFMNCRPASIIVIYTEKQIRMFLRNWEM